MLVSVLLPIEPISADPTVLPPMLPALSVWNAANVNGVRPPMKLQLQFPPEPTVAVPTVVVPLSMVTTSPASPVPRSVVALPPVKAGAPGAVVSIVSASALEAALTFPIASAALTVILWVPFARVGAVKDQVPRAVQRSIHDAHGEDCTDAAEGDAMPTI